MPIFIASLLGGLIQLAGTLVGRVLISLGFGYVNYSGINILMSNIETLLIGQFSTLPPELLAVMSVLEVGTCVNILISAVGIRLLLNGLLNGSFTKLTIKS